MVDAWLWNNYEFFFFPAVFQVNDVMKKVYFRKINPLLMRLRKKKFQ